MSSSASIHPASKTRRNSVTQEQNFNAKLVHRLYEGFAAGRSAGDDTSDEPQAHVLLPGSSFLLTWELVSFGMLMYTAFAVPFQLAFSSSGRWDVDKPTTYIETLVDIFFIARRHLPQLSHGVLRPRRPVVASL